MSIVFEHKIANKANYDGEGVLLGKFFLVSAVISVIYGAVSGRLGEVSSAALGGAAKAVTLSLELLGTLCFWSGLMRVAEKAGITKALCKLLSPLLNMIFPKLKGKSEVMEPISMNIAANMLGVGNAATPLGISAMKKLREISPRSDFATKEMVSFVVMNTASLQILPTTVAALRMEAGAKRPFDIILSVWFVSLCSLIAGMVLAKLFYPESEQN